MRPAFVEVSPVHSSASPEERDADGGDDEAYHSLWVNWNNEIVESNKIDWREGFANAKPDEGSLVDTQDADLYFTVPPGKLPRDMTKEEVGDNWKDVSKANVREITGLYEFGCSKRCPRHISKNINNARWVITWKMIGGNVGINCRLTVRGFKDNLQVLDTYAGATSRSGQSPVNAAAVENPDFVLFSLDVSQAFAKGMTFEELSALSGRDIREVEFDAPRADIDSLRELPDLQDFDPVNETLAMLKRIYVLKVAPRAWQKKLHQVFVWWMSCRQLHAEPEFYCVHQNDARCQENTIQRAVEHNE